MTYEKIYDLKYRAGISTNDLMKLFPHEVRKVGEVALLDLPVNTIKAIVREEAMLNRLIRMKRRFHRTDL